MKIFNVIWSNPSGVIATLSVILVLVIMYLSFTATYAKPQASEPITILTDGRNISLPANQKLINEGFDNSNFWYITRPMHPSDSAETYTFMQGRSIHADIIIHETRQ